MILLKNFFMRSPGNENESGNISPDNSEETKIEDQFSADTKEKSKEKKSVFKKIHDALQDWSNGDQREQEIDDKRP